MEDAELFLGLGSSLPAFDSRPVVSRGFQGVHVSAETLRGTESEAGGGAEGRARADPRLDPAEGRRVEGRQGGPTAGLRPGATHRGRARRLRGDGPSPGVRFGRRGDETPSGQRRAGRGPAATHRIHRPPAGALPARPRLPVPGCGARFCDAHHVRHWAEGGATRLDNLLLLCRHHHRRVHEEGWSVTLEGSGEARFHRPDGRLLPGVPETPAVPLDPVATLERRPADLGIGPGTATSRWNGERLDLDWAIAVLGQRWAPHDDGVSAETSAIVGRRKTASPRRRPPSGGAVIPGDANPSLHLANRTD